MGETSDKTKRNIALLCEYEGSEFAGWQIQKNAKTVQDEIAKAIYQITGETVTLYGCSRTDAGVHARGHVSNFFTSSAIPPEKIPLALNSKLPLSITVKNASVVSEDFNARFSALGKKYSYTIFNSRSRPAIQRMISCHIPGRLSVKDMKAAAKSICGKHDFSAFMASNSAVKSTVRTVRSVTINEEHPLLTIEIQGDGFLYNMVRIIAGTLVYAGTGKIAPEEIGDIIKSGDRRRAGKTLPAHGLCLEEVYYENKIFPEQ